MDAKLDVTNARVPGRWHELVKVTLESPLVLWNPTSKWNRYEQSDGKTDASWKLKYLPDVKNDLIGGNTLLLGKVEGFRRKTTEDEMMDVWQWTWFNKLQELKVKWTEAGVLQSIRCRVRHDRVTEVNTRRKNCYKFHYDIAIFWGFKSMYQQINS